MASIVNSIPFLSDFFKAKQKTQLLTATLFALSLAAMILIQDARHLFLITLVIVIWVFRRHQLVEQMLEEEIAEKKRIELSLREALFYRDEFLSIASHELKTPLTSLRLQAQLFKRALSRQDPEALSEVRVERLVNEVDRQVGRLTGLVDDMLDISRIRTGRLSLHKEEVSLSALIKRAIEMIAPKFRESGRSVPLLLIQEDCLVNCDPQRIEQVLNNLLSNACRYGMGRPVEVILSKEGKFAQVSVKDNGMGISLANQERIFSRFQRAVPASEISGLGLGLFISKQIIEAHGGTIGVESELEKGAVFKFRLPL